jgi:hypothetical protein
MSSPSGIQDIYFQCMKEAGNIIYEQQVLEGEILPPLKKDQETAGSNPEREAPVVHLNLTEIKEIAAKDPDIALTYIVNFQPVVEASAKHPIEELVENATEGLLTGAENIARGAVRLADYRALRRAQKPPTLMRAQGGGEAAQRPQPPALEAQGSHSRQRAG